jgi:beta-lactam-binding protein with PASTA domain
MPVDSEPQPLPAAPPLEELPPIPPKRKTWPWIAGAVVAVAVVLGVLWATGVFTQKIAVPDVVGKALSSAETSLSDAGFKLGTVAYQAAAGKPQGTVLSQTPVAGTEAKHDSAVNLVAVGTNLKTVPNVVGMTQAAAKTAITSAGLTLGSVALVYDNTTAKETVTGQAPAAGSTAPAGSPVAITVSRGPTPAASPTATAVPNVIGQTQSQATTTLQSLGFAVVVDAVPSTTVAAGNVFAQSPAGGVMAQPATAVTIVVSSGATTASPAP